MIANVAPASSDVTSRSGLQRRNTWYLLLGNGLGSATGFVFWWLVAGFAGLPPAEVGAGYTVIALATIAALLAKGGMDGALLRNVPRAVPEDAKRMLRTAMLVATLVAATLTIAGARGVGAALGPHLSTLDWTLLGLLAALLAVTWIHDAYIVATADARYTFLRNVAFAGGRVLLPLPLIALAVPSSIPLVWALALGASLLLALRFAPHTRPRGTERVPRRQFFQSAARHATGGLAEFLPGLLLVPLVFALHGARAAAYFGVAWTAASLLFLASGSISRSAFAEFVHVGPAARNEVLRRSVREHVLWLTPALVALAAFAWPLLRAFGPSYAANSWVTLLILGASVVFVGPLNLWMAYLRATENSHALAVVPAVFLVLLVGLVALLGPPLGLEGIALAWLAATAPMGAWSAWKLRTQNLEVSPHAAARAHRGHSHLE